MAIIADYFIAMGWCETPINREPGFKFYPFFVATFLAGFTKLGFSRSVVPNVAVCSLKNLSKAATIEGAPGIGAFK